jgi:signal transduction histidine kinase
MNAVKKREKRPKKKAEGFEEEYFAALQNYVKHATEEQLKRAYELGRRGVDEGKTLVDIAAIHHGALRLSALHANGTRAQGGVSLAAADFLAECLSPYEMARRGFHDAVKALRQMNETLEEEIKRIAYAVHDEAGQLLVTVHLALADLGRDLPENKKEQIARIEELLKQAEGQLRRYSHELRPTILDDFGWISAIRFLSDGVAKRSNVVVQVKTEVRGRLPVAVETAVYRVVQEALNNAIKHGKASRVSIDIRPIGGEMCCSIRDNGVGFNVSAKTVAENKPRGLGLIAMRERMNGIGGSFSIDAVRGKGTRVVIRFPVEDADGNSNRSRG